MAFKNLITQMGIQVHSFYDYKLATLLIKSGIIGKVSTVRAWCPKNWGYDGPAPIGEDSIPNSLDWNLWLGTAKERPYKEKIYHPGMWRKIIDFGCGHGNFLVSCFSISLSRWNSLLVGKGNMERLRDQGL